MAGFNDRLQQVCKTFRSVVCVGLDPDPNLMPISDLTVFNSAIVDATKDLVCAYKPNLSFYEALGLDGLKALENTIRHIRDHAPNVLVLGDAKRGDIASTNHKYARALFDYWGFDGITVNAYAGGESLLPFFEYRDKGVFVWCHSSNQGSREFQDLRLTDGNTTLHLYEWVAKKASDWNLLNNVGLVVGATYPQELARVRASAPGLPILIPGVGVQEGELDESVKSGLDSHNPNIIVNSSRGIIYASHEATKFDTAARKAAQRLRQNINLILTKEGWSWD